MRNNDARVNGGNGSAPSTRLKGNSLFKLLKKEKPTRSRRESEIYQKMYSTKIKEEALRRGYGELTEDADAEQRAMAKPLSISAEATVLTEAELERGELEDERPVASRSKQLRSQRMTLWQATAKEMFQAESEEVKSEVERATIEANANRSAGNAAGAADEMTPADYQQ